MTDCKMNPWFALRKEIIAHCENSDDVWAVELARISNDDDRNISREIEELESELRVMQNDADELRKDLKYAVDTSDSLRYESDRNVQAQEIRRLKATLYNERRTNKHAVNELSRELKYMTNNYDDVVEKLNIWSVLTAA